MSVLNLDTGVSETNGTLWQYLSNVSVFGLNPGSSRTKPALIVLVL